MNKSDHDTPKYYLTKTWGFAGEEWPLLVFGSVGARENLRSTYKAGDWVIIAGTSGYPTEPEDQGRLLGMCQVDATFDVDTLKVLNEIGTELSDLDFNEKGEFRWPYGLPIIRVLEFSPPPDLKDIVGSYLPGQVWAAYALNLAEKLADDIGEIKAKEVIQRIQDLPVKEIDLPDVPSIKKRKIFNEALQTGRNGPSGPPPSDQREGSTIDLSEGYTYAFKLEGGKYNNVIKIGYSKDYKSRLMQLNKELRPHLTGCRWNGFYVHKFQTAQYAYNFEQLLIDHFKAHLVEGEREVVMIPEDEFIKTWSRLFSSNLWQETQAGFLDVET